MGDMLAGKYHTSFRKRPKNVKALWIYLKVQLV